MIFSRRRVCLSEASARLFSPLCWRCSIPGARSAFATPYDRSLSVTITRGCPQVLNNFLKKRLVAVLFRRD